MDDDGKCRLCGSETYGVYSYSPEPRLTGVYCENPECRHSQEKQKMSDGVEVHFKTNLDPDSKNYVITFGLDDGRTMKRCMSPPEFTDFVNKLWNGPTLSMDDDGETPALMFTYDPYRSKEILQLSKYLNKDKNFWRMYMKMSNAKRDELHRAIMDPLKTLRSELIIKYPDGCDVADLAQMDVKIAQVIHPIWAGVKESLKLS